MAIKQRITNEVQKYREIAASKGYTLPHVPIDFSLRGACAGQACHMKADGRPTRLRFNLALAERHPEEFLSRTVPHECAHVLQFMRNPNSKPHGHEWDFFCRLLTGSTMDRCHTYDVSGIKRTRKVQKFKYVCECDKGLHLVSSIKHNRILRGANYKCVRCGCRIKQLMGVYAY